MSLLDRLRNKRGQTIVLFAVLLPILVGMTGLVVDAGVAYVHKSRLQNAVDAAAAAGALDLKTVSNHGTSEATARDCLSKNAVGAAAVTAATITYPALPGDPGAMLIRVSVTETVPSYFIRVFGLMENYSVTAAATAQAFQSGGPFSYGIFSTHNLTINGGTTQSIVGDIYGGTSVAVNGGIPIIGTAETAGTFKNTFNATSMDTISTPLPLPEIHLDGKTTLFSTIFTKGTTITAGDYTKYGIVILDNPDITMDGIITGTFYSPSGSVTLKKATLTGLLYLKSGNITFNGTGSTVIGGLVADGDITINGGMSFVQQPESVISNPVTTHSKLIS